MDVDAFRERSRQSWDAVAAGWETRCDFLERNMGLLHDWVIERIDASAGQTVLDVGAGPGDLGHRIAHLVGPTGRVISTDFALEMVEIARRLGAARNLDNVEYRQLDAEQMDLEDATIDAVVCRSGYMLFADPATAFGEAQRVLREGGSLAFTVFTTPEQNPWAAIPGAALVGRGHVPSPQPGAPGVFALGDPDRVRDLVTGAGFSEPEIEAVDFVFHYAGDDDAWNAVVDLNAPLSVIIDQLPDRELAATRDEVVDHLGMYRNPDGSYPVPAQALAVHATKPVVRPA
jgi:ubiquinone/menaquinone biosynthesis C-methylase UbiE